MSFKYNTVVFFKNTVTAHVQALSFLPLGGEEFLLIMQCEHDAAVIAEKIKKEVENTPIDYNGKTIHATISVGVCIIGDISGITVHNAIEQADKAMYQSKNSGKNRVTVKTVN